MPSYASQALTASAAAFSNHTNIFRNITTSTTDANVVKDDQAHRYQQQHSRGCKAREEDLAAACRALSTQLSPQPFMSTVIKRNHQWYTVRDERDYHDKGNGRKRLSQHGYGRGRCCYWCLIRVAHGHRSK